MGLFDFKYEVKRQYRVEKEVYSINLSDIFDTQLGHCQATPETNHIGVYALYENDELKKIGRAITGAGIFTRLSQYYREDCGSKHITSVNKNNVKVMFFHLNSNKECWAGEKRLQ